MNNLHTCTHIVIFLLLSVQYSLHKYQSSCIHNKHVNWILSGPVSLQTVVQLVFFIQVRPDLNKVETSL